MGQTPDEAAVRAVEQHHARMMDELRAKAERLLAAAAGEGGADDERVAEQARLDLAAWAASELVPHALAEEKTMYAAAGERPEGRLLVEALLADHRRIVELVERLSGDYEPVRAAADGRALLAMFEGHLAKENEQVLPLLLAADDVSVAELLGGMHELLGESA